MARLKCVRCRIWCGDRITTATPRLRASAPNGFLCQPCFNRRYPRKERIGLMLYRFAGFETQPGDPFPTL